MKFVNVQAPIAKFIEDFQQFTKSKIIALLGKIYHFLYRIVNHSVYGKHIRKVKYKAVVTVIRSRECYNLSVHGPAVNLLITCCCCTFWYYNQHQVFIWSLIYSWINLPSFPGLIWSLITSILLQLLSLLVNPLHMYVVNSSSTLFLVLMTNFILKPLTSLFGIICRECGHLVKSVKIIKNVTVFIVTLSHSLSLVSLSRYFLESISHTVVSCLNF